MLTQTAQATDSATVQPTVWYWVTVAGDKTIIYTDGTIDTEFSVESFRIELTETYMGQGHLQQIQSEAAVRYPGYTIIEWWMTTPPADGF